MKEKGEEPTEGEGRKEKGGSSREGKSTKLIPHAMHGLTLTVTNLISYALFTP